MLALYLLAVLLLLDIVTTRLVIAAGGRELNPIYEGNPTVLKMVVTHAVILGAFAAGVHYLPGVIVGAWVAVAIFVIVDVNNLLAWRKQRRSASP